MEVAREAGLVYTTDSSPGMTRKRSGRGFSYRDADGDPVRDRGTLERVRRLAIPPAWTDVWISRTPAGHLQATGRDARGRKQHRYHPAWRELRDANKYARLLDFARALPPLRRRVARDLRRRDLSRERVLAAVVSLLEATRIRVGNEEYARANASYGLTTLRDRHVRVRGQSIEFTFRGKSGREHCVSLRDPRLARLVARCEELPGQVLFQYVDSDGSLRPVDSADVNEYIRQVTGGEFSAKDFRTWSGTVLALRSLLEVCEFASEAEARRNIVRAVDCVAEELGNTRAVCRRSYVHPGVVEAYLDGTTLSAVQSRLAGGGARTPRGLDTAEKLCYLLLEAHARAAVQKLAA